MMLVIPLAAAVAAILAHVAVARLPGPGGTVPRFLLLAAIGGPLLAACLIKAYGLNAEALSLILVYAFCCELYLFLVTLSFASVSANILTRLLAAPLPRAALEGLYSGGSMSALRAARLPAAGFVAAKDGRLVLLRRGRLAANCAAALRRLFNHDRAESNPADLWAAVIATIFFALMIAPCVATLATGAALAQFEEAIGYRYFYSLRVVYGHETPWIPQGHALGIFQHLVQLLLSGLGYPLDDVGARITAFIGINAAFWMGLAAILVYKLCRDIGNVPVAAALVALLYVLANAAAAELYWYAYPDYPSVTLVLALTTAIWMWRIMSDPQKRELTRRRMLWLGLFAGLAIGNKITNVVYPVALGALFLIYDRGNFRRLLVAAVLSLGVFWLVVCLYYLRLDAFPDYLKGLKIFVMSQMRSGTRHEFPGFLYGLLVHWPWREAMFLLPAAMIACTLAGLASARLRPALAFLPGLLFIADFYFQRTYSWSAMEIYLYVWVCCCGLAFLFAPWRSGALSSALAAVGVLAVCFSGYDVGRRAGESIPGFARYNDGYLDLARAVAGKNVLNLTPGNYYRMPSVYSSMCKGAMNIFNPKWGDSRLLAGTFPAYACEVVPGTDIGVARAGAIVFRRLEPDSVEEGVGRLEWYFSVGLRDFHCSAVFPVPSGDFVACFRK